MNFEWCFQPLLGGEDMLVTLEQRSSELKPNEGVSKIGH
jgi:hypothetical protein